MNRPMRLAPPRHNPILTPTAVIGTALLALLFCLRNPLFYGMAPGFDASLFAVMGKMWAQGSVLYRDMIDIKGPMIFAIDALGYLLGGFRGIWGLEWLTCWLGLMASWHALEQLGLSNRPRFGALLALIALYGTRYYYGNMTEDWTFHLALIGQWAFITLLLDGRFRPFPALVAAVTFALVAWMRLNNGGLWGAWYLVLFMLWVSQQQWRSALLLLLSSLFGLALVGGPLLAYFHYHGVLEAFRYYSFAIFFEGSYGSGNSLAVGAVGLFRTGLIMLLPAYVVLMLTRQWHWSMPVLMATLLGVLFTLVANSVSGHVFDHYDVLYLQLGLLPLACLLERSKDNTDGLALLCVGSLALTAAWLMAQQLGFGWSTKEWSLERVREVLGISLLWALPVLVLVPLWRAWDVRSLMPWLASLAMLLVIADNAWDGTERGRPFNPPAQVRVDKILEKSTPSDTLWVDGTWPQYYLWTDQTPASAYLFFANVNPPYDVRSRVLEQLKQTQPRFIITNQKKLDEIVASLAKQPPSTQSFYLYVLDHYLQVADGLYQRR